MRIPDILRLNDFSQKNFFLAIITILIYYIVLLFINNYLFKVPHLIQFFGFILLTFIPGFLILRILKIHNIDRILSILLVVGLSISYNTLFAFLSDLVFLYLNLKTNFLSYFIYIYVAAILFLMLICYLRDMYNYSNKFILIKLPELFMLVVLPSLSIIGTIILNLYNINNINILFIFLASLIPFFYVYKRAHAVIIWISAISILFNSQLVSDYLWGWDIHVEYNIAKLVLDTGYWDPYIYSPVNSLLSIVLLAPVYSTVLTLDLVWVYKIIYPFFFSFVPLGIYYVVKCQFKNDSLAFFSPFIFMFYYGFFKSMIDKEFIAELFLVLIVITLFDKNHRIRSLGICFLLMLALTHYGVSYIFLISLISMKVIAHILKLESDVGLPVIVFYATFLISWNFFSSGGFIFWTLVDLGHNIIINIQDIFSPDDRSGIRYLMLDRPGFIWQAYKAINIAIFATISVGIIRSIINLIRKKSEAAQNAFELIAISLYIFLLSQFFLSLNLGIDRSAQICLTILSPFAIIGLRSAINLIKYKNITVHLEGNKGLKLLSLFLCILFLFNSGLISELSNDSLPYAISLNKNPEWNIFSLGEISSVNWLTKNAIETNIAIINPWSRIKSRDGMLVMGYYPESRLTKLTPNITSLAESYVYLGKLSTNLTGTPLYLKILSKSDKLYSNADSIIYLHKS